jgi:hypothetical protein
MSEYLEAIEYLLEQWGRRAFEDSEKLGYKPGVLGRIKGSTVKSASISDHDYSTVDKAVSRLKIIDSKMWDVVGYSFVQGRSYVEIQRQMRINKDTIGKLRHGAISYVAGALNRRD